MDRSDVVEELSPGELDALKSAAAWYANYHALMIAEHADDPSAYALVQRERYADLLAGLRKLGVKLRDPLADARRTAELEREAA